MPDIDPAYAGAFTGSGDLFGLFSDKPAAKDLLKYLVTAEAQQIWVDRGGALSGNTKVTTYPDEVSKRSAEILGSAKIFRFDGGDLMPTGMQSAFFAAMVEFTANPGDLDGILAGLDEVQATAYAQ
jgi:alpha-glucoside transport system substrate-binding protein